MLTAILIDDMPEAFLKKDGGYLSMKNNQTVPVAIRKKADVMELLERLG
jgi:two-component system, LytTR family, response regulator